MSFINLNHISHKRLIILILVINELSQKRCDSKKKLKKINITSI
jgi:hypothetical protein